MKVMLVAGLIMLVATSPSRAFTPSHAVQAGLEAVAGHDQDDEPSWGRRMLHTSIEDHWPASDDQPSMNLDGTPMAGDLDLNGNFFGDIGSAFDGWDDSTT